jgi:hypothetical protein
MLFRMVNGGIVEGGAERVREENQKSVDLRMTYKLQCVVQHTGPALPESKGVGSSTWYFLLVAESRTASPPIPSLPFLLAFPSRLSLKKN